MKKRLNVAALASLVVVLSTVSMEASAVAMTVPVEITDAGLSVLVIGAAVFAIAVGVKLFKWVRRAL